MQVVVDDHALVALNDGEAVGGCTLLWREDWQGYHAEALWSTHPRAGAVLLQKVKELAGDDAIYFTIKTDDVNAQALIRLYRIHGAKPQALLYRWAKD